MSDAPNQPLSNDQVVGCFAALQIAITELVRLLDQRGVLPKELVAAAWTAQALPPVPATSQAEVCSGLLKQLSASVVGLRAQDLPPPAKPH